MPRLPQFPDHDAADAILPRSDPRLWSTLLGRIDDAVGFGTAGREPLPEVVSSCVNRQTVTDSGV